MREILEELNRVSENIRVSSLEEFAGLQHSLLRRAELVKQVMTFPACEEAHAALARAAEDTRHLHVRVQAERRRLCLEAADLQNQQRLLSEIRDSEESQGFCQAP